MKVDINECVGEVDVEKVESRGVSRQSAYIELKYCLAIVVSILRSFENAYVDECGWSFLNE